jgi:hypothetical protein
MIDNLPDPVNRNGQPLDRLAALHLRDLYASGLTDETIAACGFYTAGSPEEVRDILGWGKSYNGSLGSCLVLPYFNADGTANGYKRIKPEKPRQEANGKPRQDAEGKPAKYESPRGAGNHAYFPPIGPTGKSLSDPTRPLLVTEGEKKAAKASQEGFACIGLSGVWNWTSGPAADGSRRVIADLEQVAWQARRVFIVYDSDAAHNPKVKQAEQELKRVLKERGANVHVVRLPGKKDGPKVGLDDFLKAQGRQALVELLKKMEARAEGPGPGKRNQFPRPVPIGDLKPSAPGTRWLWDGFLSRGGITLISALWKAGKTTLLTALMKALEEGGTFCGQPVSPCRVLYVTEEKDENLWIERRETFGLARGNLHLILCPFITKPDFRTWLAFIDYLLAVRAEQDPFGLIVLDTISNLWPVKDENDACQVSEALMPLRQLSDQKTCLSLVHHLGKKDGGEATGSRGSGALSAFVDIITELRRFNALAKGDRKRVLTSYSRYRETPAELVVELSEEGTSYTAHGDRQDAGKAERRQLIRKLLPATGDGLTVKEILEDWPEKTQKPARRTLDNELCEGSEKGFWERNGGGKRGDPFRYSFLPP